MRHLLIMSLLALHLSFDDGLCMAADPLTVASDFEGGSVRDVVIDDATRTISFMPGGDPVRGWPCWWYFRVDGIAPGEMITLRLRGSTATVPKESVTKPGAPLQKPLAASWAMPVQATFSTDGETWRHTEKGTREDEWMIYMLKPDATSVFVAWGPPYTPSMAAKFVREMSEKSPHAKATELCRSRGDRAVPMLHVMEGERAKENRFGVWIQARQHAWESGSSWVAQGFGEWLLSDDADAAWLRQHAEIFLIPIMDVDNTATGNGGKDAQPQDHNRDWSAEPHWNEIIAAQRMVSGLIEEGRMDVFLDLHNPAPGDPTFFYVLSPELLKEPMIGLRDRFVELAYARISKIKPLIPMSNKPKVTGPEYHPLWRQISANWVSMNGNPHTVSLCLETIWNYQNSTTEGYRAVGANLAAVVGEYLGERLAAKSDDDPLAPWRDGVRIHPVAPDSASHTIHSYFNTCPESPDGKHVLYYTSTTREGETGDLRLLERATGKETIIAADITTEDAHRAACQQWVNGGKTIVYHDCRDGRWRVVAVDVATLKQTVLAENRQVGFGAVQQPWAPVYGCHWNPGPHRDLELIHVETGEIRKPVTVEQVVQEYGDWVQNKFGTKDISVFFPVLSPNGDKVFFKLSRPSGGSDFRSKQASLRDGKVVYDLANKRFIRLVEQWGHPAWDPQSKAIFEYGNVLMDIETGQTRRCAPSCISDHPSIAPNGRLFVTDADVTKRSFGKPGHWAIAVGSMAKDDFVVLTTFDNTQGATTWRHNHPHPAFSADGQRIYYNVNDGPWTRLFVAEAAAID